MTLAQGILVILIKAYRWVISPAKTVLFGPVGRCRFSPSCSAYALEAVVRHGAFRGLMLSLRRLLRCHPWGGCGHDPVPEPGMPTPPQTRSHLPPEWADTPAFPLRSR